MKKLFAFGLCAFAGAQTYGATYELYTVITEKSCTSKFSAAMTQDRGGNALVMKTAETHTRLTLPKMVKAVDDDVVTPSTRHVEVTSLAKSVPPTLINVRDLVYLTFEGVTFMSNDRVLPLALETTFASGDWQGFITGHPIELKLTADGMQTLKKFYTYYARQPETTETLGYLFGFTIPTDQALNAESELTDVGTEPTIKGNRNELIFSYEGRTILLTQRSRVYVSPEP